MLYISGEKTGPTGWEYVGNFVGFFPLLTAHFATTRTRFRSWPTCSASELELLVCRSRVLLPATIFRCSGGAGLATGMPRSVTCSSRSGRMGRHPHFRSRCSVPTVACDPPRSEKVARRRQGERVSDINIFCLTSRESSNLYEKSSGLRPIV